jgi:P4 family phage/plasmid primase-like protien
MSSLFTFLQNFRNSDKDLITHISQNPNGKFQIPTTELRKFYHFFNTNKEVTSILELASSNYIPLIIDVDLKIETRNGKSQKKLYEKSHVKNIINCVFNVLKEVLVDIKEDDMCSFLLERSGYIEKKNSKEYYKNGFHIHFPRIWLTRNQLECIIIPKLEKNMKEENIELPYGTTFSNVIDKSIYKGKGKPWYMYGSSKPDVSEPYHCSRVYYSNGDEDTNWKKALLNYPNKISNSIEDCMVDIFSIRSDNKSDFIYEIRADCCDSNEYINNNNNDIINDNFYFQQEHVESSRDPKQDELVDELLGALSPEYYIDRDKWIHIGWILFNHFDGCDDGFYRWDDFSKKCPEKYDMNSLKEEWNKMEKKDVTIASLKFIVRKENPELYDEICTKFTQEYLNNSLLQSSITHYDIANILHLKYQSSFVCSNIKNNDWYEFKGHTWKKIDDGNSLRKRISTDIVKEYEKIRNSITGDQLKKLQNDLKKEETNLEEFNGDMERLESRINRLDRNNNDDKKLIEKYEKNKKDLDDLIKRGESKKKNIETFIDTLSNKNTDMIIDDLDDDKKKKKMKNEKVDRINKTIANLKSTPFKKNIMTEAKDLFYDEKFDTNLNTDPWLIAFNNGVYDLKNNVFRDGIPSDYISLKMKINYRNDFTRESPEVKLAEDFFVKIFPDEELRKFFLAVQSEIFVGRNQRKIFQIWTGVGDNGKSITQEIFEKMLGDLCVKLPTSLITGKRTQSSGACPELERAGSGCRLCILQEPSETDRINMGMMKELSGNDKFYARGLHKDPKDINPMFKLVMICNKPPLIPNSQNDQATWNRTRIIPFESKFPKDKNLVPKTFDEQVRQKIFPRDVNFSDKVPQMLEGVAWMLLDIYKRGDNVNVEEPLKVTIATNEYRKRDDYLLSFVEERTRKCDEGSLGFTELYDTFKDWFKDDYPNTKIPSAPEVKENLKKLWGEPDNEIQCSWDKRQVISDSIN